MVVAEDALAVGEDMLVGIGGEFVLAELAEGPMQWLLRLRTVVGLPRQRSDRIGPTRRCHVRSGVEWGVETVSA